MIEQTEMTNQNELEKIELENAEKQAQESQVAGDNEIYAESMKDKEEGNVVKGVVVRLNASEVYIDIGYKSEGIIAAEEFSTVTGEMKLKVGDEVEVYIQQGEDKEGKVVLSKAKVDKRKIWETLADIFEKQELMETKIIKQVKGGYICNVGTDAFLPASQAFSRQASAEEKENPLGRVLKVKIIKFDKTKGNIVLSHRVVWEEDYKKQKSEYIITLKAGDIKKGKVKSMTTFGAFVDIGGVDGLLHISDISWKRLTHPSEVLKPGDALDVLVLGVDVAGGKVSLGLKQLQQNPWSHFEDKYKEGTAVKGKVSHLEEYGFFVALEDGIEGLVHVSEMSWTHRVKEPAKYYTIGQEIEVMILKIDKETKRISLGVKQLETNPWDKVVDEVTVGVRVSGKVTSVTDYGCFVEILDGVDALIHNADLSWTNNVKSAKDFLKKGDTVDAVVLSVDKEKHRISLGLKQLLPDPWTEIPTKYKEGDIITGKIMRLTHFGAFVEIESGIEGLLHISQIDVKRVDKVEEALKTGEEKIMKIIKISPEERKISLSIKKYLKDQEKEKNPEKMGDMYVDSSFMGKTTS